MYKSEKNNNLYSTKNNFLNFIFFKIIMFINYFIL